MIAARLLDHSRTGFSPVGRMIGMVRGKVGGIDRSAKLAEEFRIDSLVVRNGEATAPDAALIGDDNVEPAIMVKLGKAFCGAGEGPNPRGLITKIHFIHERAIAVEKNGALFRSVAGVFHSVSEQAVGHGNFVSQPRSIHKVRVRFKSDRLLMILKACQEFVASEGRRSKLSNNDSGTMIGNLGRLLQCRPRT